MPSCKGFRFCNMKINVFPVTQITALQIKTSILSRQSMARIDFSFRDDNFGQPYIY